MTSQQLVSTRNDILEKATELFMKTGVKNTSLAQIAQALCISKGTLYYHYSSKSELVYDIATLNMDLLISEIVDELKLKKTSDKQELIFLVIHHIVQAPRGKLQLYLLDEAISGDKELQQRMAEKYRLWRQKLMEQCMFFLDLPPKRADIFSHLLLIVIDGCLLQWHIDAEPLPYKALAEMLLEWCK